MKQNRFCVGIPNVDRNYVSDVQQVSQLRAALESLVLFSAAGKNALMQSDNSVKARAFVELTKEYNIVASDIGLHVRMATALETYSSCDVALEGVMDSVRTGISTIISSIKNVASKLGTKIKGTLQAIRRFLLSNRVRINSIQKSIDKLPVERVEFTDTKLLKAIGIGAYGTNENLAELSNNAKTCIDAFIKFYVEIIYLTEDLIEHPEKFDNKQIFQLLTNAACKIPLKYFTKKLQSEDKDLFHLSTEAPLGSNYVKYIGPKKWEGDLDLYGKIQIYVSSVSDFEPSSVSANQDDAKALIELYEFVTETENKYSRIIGKLSDLYCDGNLTVDPEDDDGGDDFQNKIDISRYVLTFIETFGWKLETAFDSVFFEETSNIITNSITYVEKSIGLETPATENYLDYGTKLNNIAIGLENIADTNPILAHYCDTHLGGHIANESEDATENKSFWLKIYEWICNKLKQIKEFFQKHCNNFLSKFKKINKTTEKVVDAQVNAGVTPSNFEEKLTEVFQDIIDQHEKFKEEIHKEPSKANDAPVNENTTPKETEKKDNSGSKNSFKNGLDKINEGSAEIDEFLEKMGAKLEDLFPTRQYLAMITTDPSTASNIVNNIIPISKLLTAHENLVDKVISDIGKKETNVDKLEDLIWRCENMYSPILKDTFNYTRKGDDSSAATALIKLFEKFKTDVKSNYDSDKFKIKEAIKMVNGLDTKLLNYSNTVTGDIDHLTNSLNNLNKKIGDVQPELKATVNKVIATCTEVVNFVNNYLVIFSHITKGLIDFTTFVDNLSVAAESLVAIIRECSKDDPNCEQLVDEARKSMGLD